MSTRPTTLEVTKEKETYVATIKLIEPVKDDIHTQWQGRGSNIGCALIKAISGYTQCLNS